MRDDVRVLLTARGGVERPSCAAPVIAGCGVARRAIVAVVGSSSSVVAESKLCTRVSVSSSVEVMMLRICVGGQESSSVVADVASDVVAVVAADAVVAINS